MDQTLFDRFLGEFPSQRKAADALNVSEALISRIRNGKRNITPSLAAEIDRITGGKYCKSALLWGDKDNKHKH